MTPENASTSPYKRRFATCAICQMHIPLNRVGGNDELWQHYQTEHRGEDR